MGDLDSSVLGNHRNSERHLRLKFEIRQRLGDSLKTSSLYFPEVGSECPRKVGTILSHASDTTRDGDLPTNGIP
jgi:hypothetical protein